MVKNLFLCLLLCFSQFLIEAQTFVTRNGYIGFFSKTPFENIKAENRQVNAVIDLAKKNIAFAALMKGFLFPKALMQEHFNENYVESDRYPKTSFTGSYTGDVDPGKDGTYNIKVNGNLTLHGVTRSIEVPATLDVKEGKLTGKTNFRIKPADYNIKIPALVKDKIAQQVDVTVKVDYSLSK
ncbi:MAG TPA: YceI family protein [Chitinophagaceae bacterium]|nr:YceI family protein [Chitinophagaceae bacterium]